MNYRLTGVLVKKVCLGALLGSFWVCSGFGTDYRIEAHLDTGDRTVTGKQVVTWTNETVFEARDLYFHLYFNAWRNDKSSFLTSNRVVARDFSDWREDEWSSLEIEKLSVIRALASDDARVESFRAFDLTQAIEFRQPDDGNSEDSTVARVPLSEPVLPGETIQIEIEFETKVPRPFARTGVRGDYYFLAHWFPKLGVFEANGIWNCHQFIQTEFYADYGKYDVKLTVPSDWVVGATGARQEKIENENGTTTTHHFKQSQVHGFAWVASPHLEEFQRRFEHKELPPVEIRLLLMPDHSGQEDRYFRATEAALELYGLWFGAYPYGHVTVVDPAYNSKSGGMEYPTLFTGGTRWLNPEDSGSPEGVTVHECGHQFWYGMVGNNEFEDAWLDEGFDTYATRKVMEQRFHPTFQVRRYLDGFVPVLFRDLPLSLRSVAGLGGYHSSLKWDRMSKPSWRYGPAANGDAGGSGGRVYLGGAYGVNSYTKPAMMLLTLERYLGWEKFQEILSTYFERFKFKRPTPQDFFSVVEEVSNQDFDWFWRETYESSDIFDYSVDSVASLDSRHFVVVRRWGEGIFPIRIKVTFEDGSIEWEDWDGKERWHRFVYERQSEIRSVDVDPEEVLALDVNRTNNSWIRSAPKEFASAKWALKWMIWLQNLFELYAACI